MAERAGRDAFYDIIEQHIYSCEDDECRRPTIDLERTLDDLAAYTAAPPTAITEAMVDAEAVKKMIDELSQTAIEHGQTSLLHGHNLASVDEARMARDKCDEARRALETAIGIAGKETSDDDHS